MRTEVEEKSKYCKCGEEFEYVDNGVVLLPVCISNCKGLKKEKNNGK